MKKTLGIIILICVVVFFVLSYFIMVQDPITNEFRDGFGRELTRTPLFFKMMGIDKQLWAGGFWFIIDNFVMITGVVIGYSLTSKN